MFSKILKKIENRPRGVAEVSAEVIHAEVDAAEDVFIKQIETFINQSTQQQSEIKIVEQEERKSKLLKDLGFENSELVKSINDRNLIISNIDKEIKNNKKIVDLFQEYKEAYPFEKIMPFSTFEKVMDKYSLIYAPNTAYIKDVPEKNLLEIKNAKPLIGSHQQKPIKYLEEISEGFYHSDKDKVDKIIKKIENDKFLRFVPNKIVQKRQYSIVVFDNNNRNYHFCENRVEVPSYINNVETIVNRIFNYSSSNTYQDVSIPDSFASGHELAVRQCIETAVSRASYSRLNSKYNLEIGLTLKTISVVDHNTASTEEKVRKICKDNGVDLRYNANFKYSMISREGIFISAPKSHFDLTNLTAVNNHGYYADVKPLRMVETKDPIAFQFLEGTPEYPEGFVRILSKWGTEDDQSYLDPEVQHEILN